MQYRRLGRSGVKVSAVSLGTWLTFGNAIDEERARSVVRRAYEGGVNLFDTANAYARGRAEEVLGRALAPFPRDSYVLATKVYFPMGDGPNDCGLSRKHVSEQCHASLRRLGTDHIDLYQAHRFDEETPVEETLRAFDDLVRQGKVLYVGVSEWSPEEILDALRIAGDMGLDPVVSNQPDYSLLCREPEEGVFQACGEHGIGCIVYSPLAQGVLTGKYSRGEPPAPGTRAADHRQNRFMDELLVDAPLARAARVAEVARSLGLTPAQAALAWCLRRSEVASAIVGASRPGQLDENLKAADVTLAPDAVARLEAAVA